MQKYEFPPSSANLLRVWLHEFKERGTGAQRPKSGRPAISNDDVAKI